ncbi:MAG: putative DNA-binding domain-containing protein [Gammaproteobacteria bacterium]
MDSGPEFTRRQYQFAAHIRDPEHQPAPDDVEDRRMQIYRELFYNNVEGFLSGTFPVLRKIYTDDAWHRLVRGFFSSHHSRSPLFLEIPREFLGWLESERVREPGDFPFLNELAHYEWVELALSISEETPGLNYINPEGDLMTGIPVLSPLAWLLAYQYPVHKISPGFLPQQAGENPTLLVVYRDSADEVGFMEINPVTKRLLELIAEDSNSSGEQLLEQIAAELAHPEPGVVVNGGMEIMKGLHEKNILPGTKRY